MRRHTISTFLVAAAFAAVVACTPSDSGSPFSPAGNGESRETAGSGRQEDRDESGPRTVSTEDQSLELGVGYDSESGEFFADKKCVLLVTGEKGGETASLSVRSVTDRHSLSKALEVEASVEVNALLGSGRGKARLAREVEMSSSSVSYAVQAQVSSEVQYARGVPLDRTLRRQVAEAKDREAADDRMRRSGAVVGSAVLLTGDARRLLLDRGFDAFRDQCGDSFVSSLFRGAELSGVFTLETTDQAQKDAFSAVVESSGPWWRAKGEAKSKMEEVQSTSKMTVHYYESGEVSQPLPVDVAGLMERAQNVKDLLAKPRLYKVAVVPYSRLANWPGRDIEPAETKDMEEVLYRYAAYQELFETTLVALGRLSKKGTGETPNIQYTFQQAVPGGGQYEVTESALRQLQDQLQGYLRDLRDIMTACDEDGWDEACDKRVSRVQKMEDPYAFRVRMPLPGGPVAATAKDAEAFRAELARRLLWDHRDRACAFSPDYPDCIPNAEAAQFLARIPIEPAAKP